MIQTIQIPDVVSDVAVINRSAESEPEAAGLKSVAVEEIWQKLIALYKTAVYPAITFSLRRRGKIIMERSLGHMRGNGPKEHNHRKEIINPHTPVCLFSTSKAVTATVMHILHERGALDVTRRVADYIPEFAKNGKADITVSDVLSHRAGFSSFTKKGLSTEIFNFDHIVQVLCEQKAELHTKGAVAYHAVTGGYILAEVVRRATGADIRTALTKYVREPMGLKYFNYGAPGVAMGDIAENYVTGLRNIFPLSLFVDYALGSSFETIVNLGRDPRFYEAIVPSANMVATAPETSLFFAMLLNRGTISGVRIMKEETVDYMTRETGNTWFDRRLMMPMRYSNGFMLGNSPVGMFGPNTKEAFGHLGFMNILCWADPAREISVALLTTGKSLGGPHVIAYGNLLRAISEGCLT